MLQPGIGVLARVSNEHQLAGELVCLAHRYGHGPALADDPALVDAAVRPNGQPTAVLDRLTAAGRAAFDWLTTHSVPAGHQLLVTDVHASPDLLLVLASSDTATHRAELQDAEHCEHSKTRCA